MKNKIYIIWIWWIWISAIARYYLAKWYEVFWSDLVETELTKELEKEWCNIIISNKDLNKTSSHPSLLKDKEFKKVIYTEAVPKNNSELLKAKKLNIEIQTYPEALAEIANNKKLITIAWTHWKSTTTSLISIVLKNSNINFTSVVWTLLKEFENKNFFHRNFNNNDDEYFILEACEYKRSFLKYKPTVWIITNIEIDHLDYYKDLNDYISAYKEYLDNIKPWWFAILNWNDLNCKKLFILKQSHKIILNY